MLGVTRMQLFEFLASNGFLSRANTVDVRRQRVEYIKSRMPDIPKEQITTKVSLFSNKILLRWNASERNKKSFLKKNADWLSEEIHTSEAQSSQQQRIVTPSNRRIKDFGAVSIRAKRRRTKNLVTSHSPEELAFAAQVGFTKQSKRHVAHVIKKATSTSPRSLRVIKEINISEKTVRPYTPEEALALIIDTKLTKSQYIKLRNGARERHCDIYPSYGKILKVKKECYPKDIIITETMGEVKLQSLLNHIVQRLAILQNEVISRVVRDYDVSNLEMIYKWGFDGSSSHSMYKQRYQDGLGSTDSDLLLTSIVPLRMIARTKKIEEIIWLNPRSSSTRFAFQ